MLRLRLRESRAEVRRLQDQLEARADELVAQAESHRAEIEGYLEHHAQEREVDDLEQEREVDRLQTEMGDLETMRDLFKERAEAASQEVSMLQAEVEIYKARDELWAKWEIRERARLEAETARMAAAKARALDLPQYEAEG
jgi:hypothetical protein